MTDKAVAGKVIGMFRSSVGFEISRGRRGDVTLSPRPYRRCDHIGSNPLLEPDRCIEPAVDDIDHLVVHRHLDLHIREGAQIAWEDLREHIARDDGRNGQPKRAHGILYVIVQTGQSLVD